MDRSIGVILSCAGHGILDTLVVIVTIDVVTVGVYERWVATYYGSSIARMFDLLSLHVSMDNRRSIVKDVTRTRKHASL